MSSIPADGNSPAAIAPPRVRNRPGWEPSGWTARREEGVEKWLAVQTVPAVTFDAWAAEHGVEHLDLVKVDVEGAELAVLPVDNEVYRPLDRG